MKKVFIYILLLLCMGYACAESTANNILDGLDLSGLHEFAEKYGSSDAYMNALQDEKPFDMLNLEVFSKLLKQEVKEPIRTVLDKGKEMLIPLLLTAFLNAVIPSSGGSADGARFLMRLMLLMLFSEVSLLALESAQNCIDAAKSFSDVVAPPLAGILSIMGLVDAAAMISPSTAMAGNVIQSVFQKYGLPICRVTLCLAIAGGLSNMIELDRITKLLKKIVNWGTGLATTIFTALLALQGSMVAGMDGIAVRTAKFAVDSASPIIGSGISDAWDSYLSGIMLAKNTLGVSGIGLLLAAGIKPLLTTVASMVLLEAVSCILGLSGEARSAHAAEQISGICQMTLALSTGALVISTVILGTVMSIGQHIAV